MKTFLLLLMLIISPVLFAPGNNFTPLIRTEATNPYLPILKACIQVESRGNRYAYNPKELAYGILQIRPVRLVDYNQRTGSHYVMHDCFDSDISVKIWMYYASQYEPRELLSICRSWNGASKENKYFAKVSKLL